MSGTPQPHVAFFGLGIMGGGMAARLLAAGFPLTVYNRSADKAAACVAAGARLANSPAEAAREARVIISMVADDAASRALWLGPRGALAAAAPGAVLIECSTLTVTWAKELAAAARLHGCELLDAPVTGSRTQAAAGELTFLVGGSSEALETIRPVLGAMGKRVIYLGATGSGALLKLVNNFVCGVQAAALAEALDLIERAGLDRVKSVELLTSGAAGSPMVRALAGRMTAPEEAPYFLLRLMTKDLLYARQEAATHGLELTTATAALRLFQNGTTAGLGDKDIAAVIEPLRQRPPPP